MTSALAGGTLGARVDEQLDARAGRTRRFFTAESSRIARLCHRMAERFARGGRLLALGASPQARSDARHVAVEFVHPVIVGKRALPAIGSPTRAAIFGAAGLAAEPEDIVIAYGIEHGDANAAAGLARRGPAAA